MKKGIYILFPLWSLCACQNKPEQPKANTNTPPQAISIPSFRIFGGADSVKPKVIDISTRPKPRVIAYKAKASLKKMLPVLLNEAGKPVLDAQGKPLLMGDGGKSNFSNFTTDNGLALDHITCSVLDPSGNLWIGTQGGGISKYDGKQFVNFTTAQGLANNSVKSISIDKQGNLWIGTEGGGISLYDGTRFTTYNTQHGLPSNHITCSIIDRAGNLWLGTYGGGVATAKLPISKHEIPHFTGYSMQQGLVDSIIFSLCQDTLGQMWFGTGGMGLSRLNTETTQFTNFTTQNDLTNNTIMSLCPDADGNLWIGTYGGGLQSLKRADLKEEKPSFSSLSRQQGLANAFVRCINRDASGNLWIGTEGGVCQYNPQQSNARISNYTTAQGLSNPIIVSITEDKVGNIWLGSRGGGLMKYPGNAFVNFTTAQGLADNIVASMAEDKNGNIWFGHAGAGVSCYDGNNPKSVQAGFTHYNAEQGLANNIVGSMLADKEGNLWFGTYGGGVSKFDGKTFTNYTTEQGLAHDIVWSIIQDKEGQLWMGTGGGGVSKFDGKTFTNFSTTQGLPNNTVYSIYIDSKDRIWLGTAGGGVSCMVVNPKNKQDIALIHFNTAHGLANNTVWSICEDKTGNLWFATEDGLSVLPNKLLSAQIDNTQQALVFQGKPIRSFRIADGLPDNFVTQVLSLPNGKMAVGTNLGITLLEASPTLDHLDHLEIYNSQTGFPVKDVNTGQHGLFLDRSGKLWAGTGSQKTALVCFNPAAMNTQLQPPLVMLQSIKINDENLAWYSLWQKQFNIPFDSATALLDHYLAFGRNLSHDENAPTDKSYQAIQFDSLSPFNFIPQHLKLPFQHNHIGFEFTAIETGRPFMVKYRYLLEGYDKTWSPPTSKSSANFGNMSEGTYTFKLKAQGANGIWSEPIAYQFRVLPPWYRSIWAYMAYVATLLLSLRLFIRWRIRKINAEKIKLELTVKRRTWEVEKQKEELVIKNRLVEEQKANVEAEKQRSDQLLLNILPEEIAKELKETGRAEARNFDNVCILFTDFKDFTERSATMNASDLLEEINTCFEAFDMIADKYGVEKIKTIGDAYMAVGGLPIPTPDAVRNTVLAALDMQAFIKARKAEKELQGEAGFDMRVGIHTGPVVAGIVGVKKFQYDIWGDTVNTASRMESSGEIGKVNISEAVFHQVKNEFLCTYRGEMAVKGKGNIAMYIVDGPKV